MLRIPQIQDIAKVTSKLQNSKSMLPILLIEAAVIGGRSYQGYKRGGKDELRERVFEESITAAVWLGGIKGLNKLGDHFGKKYLKLDKLNYDVGKDALRNPSLHMPDATKVFKFSKIAASVLLTTSFMGFILPKIKQNMTKKVKEKELANYIKVLGRAPTMEEYVKNARTGGGALSFKGGAPAWLTTVSHNLENHNIWRLVSTDAGIITGRVKSSRNKYEAREYAFRDIASMYFYMGSLSHTLLALNKASKTAKINPLAALETQKHIIKQMGEGKFSVKELGEKLLQGKPSAETVENIMKKSKIVELDTLKGIFDAETFKKAFKMSRMQPMINGKRVLSSVQIKDVLSNNWLSDPNYLNRMTIAATDGLSVTNAKFVSKKEVEAIRQSADNFAQNLLDFARKKGVGQIDAEFVENFARRNILKSAGFTAAGLVVACFGLGYLVPKLQQFITYKTTGEHAFPGTHAYNKDKHENT